MKYIILLSLALVGCNNKPPMRIVEPMTIDHLYPTELSTIIHLKESNYQIGISSHPEALRKGEEWVLQAIMQKGQILYIKRVGERVK